MGLGNKCAITLYIERLTKFSCCACPAFCTCGNANKRNVFRDEELGTPLIRQKPAVGGHQHYLSSVLTFLIQTVSICWTWFLRGIWAPFAKRGCFWNFPSLPSTEEIGSNTPSASCMVMHRDSQDESSHHLDVLPSLLVKVVLTHLWFLVILNVRQKKMGVCCLQLDLTSFSLKSSSLHIYLLESKKTTTPRARVHPLIFS